MHASQKRWSHKKLFMIGIIILLNITDRFALYLYVPTMPEITQTLDASVELVQFSFLLYLVGSNIGQPFFIYLFQSVVDKKVFLIMVLSALISSLCLALLNNIYLFILFRFFQGLSFSFLPILIIGFLQQNFTRNEFSSILSLNYAIEALVAITSPLLGATISHYLGWHSIFMVIASLSALSLGLVYAFFNKRLQVFTPLDRQSDLLLYAKRPVFISSLVSLILCSAIVVVFEINATFIFQSYYSVSAIHYGFIVMLITSFLFLGSVCNNCLVKKVGVTAMYSAGCGMILLGASLLLVLNIYVHYYPVAIIFPMLFFYMGITMTIPNITMVAITDSSNHASVLMFFLPLIHLCIQMPLVSLITTLPLVTPLRLAMVLFGLMSMMMGLYSYIRRQPAFLFLQQQSKNER